MWGKRKDAYDHAVDWILEFLNSKSLKVAMFLTMENVQRFLQYTPKIVAEGHPIGLLTHSIGTKTRRGAKALILKDGTNLLQDETGRTIDMFRGGMFYLDREMVNTLVELGYRIDSSLMPGRKSTGALDGKHVTRRLKFNKPTDYRGFPAHPYFLREQLLEVPPSPYGMNYLERDSMMRDCMAERTRLTVLHIHASNLDGWKLAESAEGRYRRGFVKVVEELEAHNYRFMSFEELLEEGPFSHLAEPYKKLP